MVVPLATKWRIVEQADGSAQIFMGRTLRRTTPDVASARRHVKDNIDVSVDTCHLEEADGYATDITSALTGRRRRGWRQ